MTLTDQLRAILKKAGAPMSLNQIMEILPVGVDRNTVGALLSQRKRVGEFTHCVEDGKAAYAWAGVVVSDVHVTPQQPLLSPIKVSVGVEQDPARKPIAPVYAKPLPEAVVRHETSCESAVDHLLRQVHAGKAKAPLTSLLEEVGDSAARVADALYEAIQACASKTLMAKLAVAHKALHEAHVELLGAVAGN